MATPRAYRILDTFVGDTVLPLYYSPTGPSPISGPNGTLSGSAPIGALLLTAGPGLYQNNGTMNSPAWTPVVVAGANANNQPTIGVVTGPQSTSVFQMQGFAGAITPKTSGNVLLIVSGTLNSSSGTVGVGSLYQLSYGTGTAPANGGALAGTQVGAIQEYTNQAAVTAADVNVPFSIQFFITGLTVGTPYWLDLAAKAVAAAGYSFSNVQMTAVEI